MIFDGPIKCVGVYPGGMLGTEAVKVILLLAVRLPAEIPVRRTDCVLLDLNSPWEIDSVYRESIHWGQIFWFEVAGFHQPLQTDHKGGTGKRRWTGVG